MTILDKVHATFESTPIGEQFSRTEIVRRVNERFGVTQGSIIPSDYCYNLVNKDKLTNPALFEFNIFKHIDSKTYVYYGKNYRYNGSILHKIDSRYLKVGEWKNGVRIMIDGANEPGRRESERCAGSGSIIKDNEATSVIKRRFISNSDNDYSAQSDRFSRVVHNDVPTNQYGASNVAYLWDKGNQYDCEHALDNYWGAVSSGNMELEREFGELDPSVIRSMNVEQFYRFLFYEYFVWKYTAKNRLATTRMSLEKYQNEDRMDELAAIHRQLFSFDHRDIERGLSITKQIRGLGTAGASGLLAVLFPADFGTMDQFVVKALCEVRLLHEHQQIINMSPESLSVKDGVAIISIYRRKAAELNRSIGTDIWTPRMIDMVLWAAGRVRWHVEMAGGTLVR